jgi:hypothetical protein
VTAESDNAHGADRDLKSRKYQRLIAVVRKCNDPRPGFTTWAPLRFGFYKQGKRA